MKCKIYLNDGEDHFFGFKNDFANSPELTMVHEWDFDDDWANKRMISMHPYPVLLETIWGILNEPYPITEFGKTYRSKQLRSLSVGDVVSIGETAWSVESHGWKRVTTDELSNAIIWNDETERCEA